MVKIYSIPQSIWQLYPYEAGTHLLTTNNNSLELSSSSIIKHLNNSSYVIILAATIGHAIENIIEQYFKTGDYTTGFLIDAAATAAVEQLADNLSIVLQNQFNKSGYHLTSRFSPGYGNWQLDVQPELLASINASVIGIDCTESYMLKPRKSITAVIGLEKQTNITKTACINNNSCQHCQQRNCPSRKENY